MVALIIMTIFTPMTARARYPVLESVRALAFSAPFRSAILVEPHNVDKNPTVDLKGSRLVNDVQTRRSAYIVFLAITVGKGDPIIGTISQTLVV
jgi:hypothetical protein